MADKQWTFSRMQRIIGGKPVINCGDYMGFQKRIHWLSKVLSCFFRGRHRLSGKEQVFFKKMLCKKTEVGRVR
jgi:hypothetical protein